MSETTYQVLCPDGQCRTFHQGHLAHGSWQGFVYAKNKRVYGAVPVQTTCFVPNADAKHAALVSGTFTQPDAIDAAVNAVDEPIERTNEEFALAGAVD